jgi:plasmid maintenance system antidote protein VapI
MPKPKPIHHGEILHEGLVVPLDLNPNKLALQLALHPRIDSGLTKLGVGFSALLLI